VAMSSLRFLIGNHLQGLNIAAWDMSVVINQVCGQEGSWL